MCVSARARAYKKEANTYVCVCVCIYTHIHKYRYIYIEREREKERERLGFRTGSYGTDERHERPGRASTSIARFSFSFSSV